MKEFKGTKGEWETRSSDPTIITEGLVDIAEVFCQDMHNKDTEQASNAKLIAASKDLLEALQGMLSRFMETDKGMIKSDHVKIKAQQAINKAIGYE